MKINTKGLALITVLIFIVSTPSLQAYTPDNEIIQLMTFSDVADKDSVNVGTLVNMTIVMKNLTNDTISNMTIFQTIAKEDNIDSISLFKSPYGLYEGEAINYSSSEIADLSITNSLTDLPVPINYLNVTNYNFTLNIPTLNVGEEIGISFTMNFTEEGLFIFNAADLDYYDHWGDTYSMKSYSDISVNVVIPEVDPMREFIPEFETTELDYKLVLYITLGTIIIALASRALYLKKPIN